MRMILVVFRSPLALAPFLALALGAASAAEAQVAYPVASVAVPGGGSDPRGFTQVGNAVFFAATDGANGRELWRTDGTAAGTRIVRDLFPGPGGSFPDELTSFAGRLFFSSTTVGLATSDGTAAGTHGFAPDLQAASDLTVLGGLLLMAGRDSAHGVELWRSDGTEAGTALVKDVLLGSGSSDPRDLTLLGGHVYFTAGGPQGRELWRTDGTAAGTVLVADIDPGPSGSNPRALAAVGGRLFFEAASPGVGRELWTSDGTAAGTRLVADSNPGSANSSIGPIADFGGVAFYANAHPATGSEIWRSDGTAAGTQMLKDLHPGPASSSPEQLLVVGPRLFFVADDGVNGFEVWRCDGTAAGTEVLRVLFEPFNPPPDRPLSLTAYGALLVFTARATASNLELWRSDGTEAGTVPVGGGVWNAEAPTVAGDWIYFSGGREPWRSDATAAGTNPIEVIGPPSGGGALELTDLNGSALFATQYSGAWHSGGTPATTFPITPPVPSSGFGLLGGRAYFSTPSLIEGGFSLLWRTNEAGTVAEQVGALAGFQMTSMTTVGDRLFFVLNDLGHGRELWQTDGTPAGTGLVRDIRPGSASSQPTDLRAVGNLLLFFADDGASGLELWRSDGTEAGTTLVRDVNPGPSSSVPLEMTVLGTLALFSALDGSTGRELWRSDGTTAGTVLVKDIHPSSWSSPSSLTVVEDLVFFKAYEPISGLELWRTDGTEAGTQLVADLLPGAYTLPWPEPMGAFGTRLIFSAEDGFHGRELWATDGTVAGTSMLKDVEPGPDSSLFLNDFGTAYEGFFFFRAYTGATGYELWRSDGTAAGTQLVQEVDPGPGSSGLLPPLVGAGNHLFFNASDPVFGSQLWAARIRPDLSATATLAEGDAGPVPAAITVTAAPALVPDLVATYSTRPGTATEGVDYLAAAGSLTFSAGATSRDVSLTVVGDLLDEPNETLFLDFVVPLGPPTSSAVTLIDDDPEPRLAAHDVTVVEGDAGTVLASFTATLSEPSGREVKAHFSTHDFTAIAPSDYLSASGTLTFAPGETSRGFEVVVNGDTTDEPDERFRVSLFGEFAEVPDPSLDVMIRDDDGVAISVSELLHGQDRRDDLSGPLASDLFVLERPPYSSFEVLLDGASGDVGVGQGPSLERLGVSGTFVLQSSSPVGTGPARSLRIMNSSFLPAVDYVRVRSQGCTTDCGADDMYALRVRETTVSVPRVNNTGSQVTYLLLRNTGTQDVGGWIVFWRADGSFAGQQFFSLSPARMVVLDASITVSSFSGSATIVHTGGYGQLTGKAVSVDAAAGFSFDTPFVWRSR